MSSGDRDSVPADSCRTCTGRTKTGGAQPEENGREGVVAVGVSGGVDSSVAALMLKREGWRVVGVSHRVWSSPSNPHVVAELRAEAVCRDLGIPFFSIDITEDFRRRIVEDFVRRYEEGLTPNPCVLCNEQIKFGLFPRLVRERLEREGLLSPEESLYTATGHYVRSVERNGKTYLARAVDNSKDQSYMLYRVDPEILPCCIFPLGEYTKDEVIRIAEEKGLPTAGVGESQDICFIEGSYVDYIEKYLGYTSDPGPIEDSAGRRLGTHRGYMNYTVGQRQGLGLSDGPWYVASIESERNAVIVHRRNELGKYRFTISGLRLMDHRRGSFDAEVRVRYNSYPIPCRVERSVPRDEARSETAEVVLEEEAVITPGQSAVFYEGDILIGGGFILPEGRKRA